MTILRRGATLIASLALSLPALSQNVGIGTATPLEKLHVAGNIRADLLAGANTRIVGANTAGTLVIVASGTNGQVLTQTAGGPIWQTPTLNWALLGNAGTSVATDFLGTTDNQDLAIRTNNTEKIRVQSGGNVGIGLNGPVARLHVGGDVRVGLLNPANTGAFPNFGSLLYFCGGPAGASYNSDNSDPIWMARYNAASDQSELRINLSDNCTAVDAFVIQTGGSGCAANTVYFRFDGVGDAYRPGGGAWLAISDRRLKRDIEAYRDGLATLRSVAPVTYQYNGVAGTPDNGQAYVGVIAQDLQAVAPYMVKHAGEYLTVDPSAFTYLLINAVKEQDAEIQALKQQQSAQAAELGELRQAVEELRKRP